MRRTIAIIMIVDTVISLAGGFANTKIAKQYTQRQQQTEIVTAAQDLNRNDPENIGTFSLTFYVPSKQYGKLTYSGETATHLMSCAVDPDVIPLGSVIKITGDNGQTLLLRCNDIGSGIKGNRVDIFWDDSVAEGYDWMADFGTIQTVYIVE